MTYQQNPSMTYYIVYWIVAALAVILTSKVIQGVKVSGFFSALWAALMISVANYFLWPIFLFLTLPLNIITLGLFTFVVNGLVLKIASLFVPGFQVEGFFAAVFGSLFLSVVSWFLHSVFV